MRPMTALGRVGSTGCCLRLCARSQSRTADAHLEGFKGILQVNGYAGYSKLADRGDVRLAFCWSHVRRNFYELATPGPAPIASEALEHIAALYAVEKEIRGRSADKRRAGRQQKSRSLVDAIEPWSPSRD
jgi:transposase